MDDDLFQNLLESLHEALAYAQGDTTKGKLHRWCGICRRKLDQPDDLKSIDCGGDCWGCMEIFENPDADGWVFNPEFEMAKCKEQFAMMKEAVALRRLRQLAAESRAFNLAYMDAHPERFMSVEEKKAKIVAMTPAEFREWCRGKHRSTYTLERQWRTDDRNARKLAAKAAGEPWGPNDPRSR